MWLNPSTLLLISLIAAAYAGNYLSFPFGFGVDFLFGSIAILVIVSLYGIWWGTLASAIAGSYTITLWQHPYALIIFTCETLFVAWRLRRGNQNLLFVDMIFWLVIGMPLVWLFYGNILRVGEITTSIILVKQPVNGIFNALIASLILTYKPLYRWANPSSQKVAIFFEENLLNLLVAFVLIPALMLMVVNNRVVMRHERNILISTLSVSANNLATDLLRWHPSALEALRQLAETSSQTKIVVSGQTQESMELAIRSLPIFRQIYIINADRQVIAKAPLQNGSSTEDRLVFSNLTIPRKPEIFVRPNTAEGNFSNSQPNTLQTLQPKMLQTLPIILNNRWLGNIIAELNIDFIAQLLQTEIPNSSLQSTLLDRTRFAIASSNRERNSQPILNRRQNGEISYIPSDYQKNGVYHWLPIMEGKPLIARWKESFYGQEIPINEEIPLSLVVEAPAAPYIDYLQSLYIRSLTILLLISLLAILVAKVLSRLLVKPIWNLAKFTTNVPDKLLRAETIQLPRSSVREMNALASNFEVMSQAIKQNIQQIQKTNQELKQAKEIAEEANRTKDRFLANISHELKTPLSNIIGYTRLIQKSSTQSHSPAAEEANVTEWLGIVDRNGKNLLSLIDEILDLSKTKAHKMTLSPKTIDLSAFIEDIVKVTAIKVAEKNIGFKYETVGNLPISISADEKRLRQILFNLLNNAIKFTNRGGVTLKIYAIDRLQTSNNNPIPQVILRFAVIDTGIGMTRQDVTKIFQPFEQVGTLEARNLGTGLGLAICQMLVELMGGKLKVKSKPNKGSIFWFDLVFPEIKVTSQIKSKSLGKITGYQGQPITLLVIDDVATIRLLFMNMLEPLGFKVITAGNGQKGLELALQHIPSLILTDLFMPMQTGFTLVPEIRKIESLQQIPIIAISASNLDELIEQSRAMGCDDFLAKPIDEEKLLNLLGKYLNLKWIYE